MCLKTSVRSEEPLLIHLIGPDQGLSSPIITLDVLNNQLPISYVKNYFHHKTLLLVAYSEFHAKLWNKAKIYRDDRRASLNSAFHIASPMMRKKLALIAARARRNNNNGRSAKWCFCCYRAGRIFCKELLAPPWESFSDRLHCFIAALILMPSDPLCNAKSAADIMIISAVGDKNSSTRRLVWPLMRRTSTDDYLKDNLCYLCHQGNDRRESLSAGRSRPSEKGLI